MDVVAALWAASWAALSAAARELALPALGFAALALIVRGVASLRTARAAAGEVATNAALYLLDILAVTPALAIVLAASGAFIERSGLTLSPEVWSAAPQWMVALLALLVGDFVAYWRHRLEHAPLLWPAHAIHHSDTAMTWTTGLRFHPFNRLSTALIDTSALALLGFPPWALFVNNLARHYYGLFIHSDLAWTFGPLGRVFVSPAMHRWHHVRDANGAGANFATLFSVFDQAFGTFHMPGPCTAPLGVRDRIGPGVVAQLLWPFRALYAWAAGAISRRLEREPA
jgi:sterol desaturase/sphingolipid hydroxylase (fatty acid hydroxylase superfamily)